MTAAPMLTRTDFEQVPEEYRAIIDGKPYVTCLNGQGETVSVPVDWQAEGEPYTTGTPRWTR